MVVEVELVTEDERWSRRQRDLQVQRWEVQVQVSTTVMNLTILELSSSAYPFHSTFLDSLPLNPLSFSLQPSAFSLEERENRSVRQSQSSPDFNKRREKTFSPIVFVFVPIYFPYNHLFHFSSRLHLCLLFCFFFITYNPYKQLQYINANS